MKKYFLLLLIASQGHLASAQDSRAPYFTKSLASDGIKSVFVNTSGGSISVSGATGQPARVEVYVVGNNGQEFSKEETKKRLEEDYILNIDVHDGELHATAKNRHNNMNWRRSLSIGFKVFVGTQTATNLSTSGGSIHLDNLTGNQQFQTSGGSLHMDKLNGVIKGQTSGGSINLANSKSNIELTTSGGSITATKCQGKIRLTTSGGSLNLNDLDGDIDATTSGGSIHGSRISGVLITGTSGGSVNLAAISGSVDASTSGGSMHVQVVKLGKYVKLDSSSGHVDLELPSGQGVDLDLRADRVSVDMAGTFTGSKEKDRVVGKINGGGATVDVRGNGSISVNSR